MKKAILSLFLLGACLIPSLKAATITLDTPIAVSGGAGSTVSWDFTIDNDTAYWVMLTHAEFPDGSALGTLENFPMTFPYLAPNSSPNGTVHFTINAGATPGSSVTGPINVYYYQFDVDIINWTGQDPPEPVGDEELMFANAEVSVSAVPEPGTFALLAGALALIWGWKKRAA